MYIQAREEGGPGWLGGALPRSRGGRPVGARLLLVQGICIYTNIHVYTCHNISKAKTESCARFLAEFLPADATSLGRSGGGGAAGVAGVGAASGDVCEFPPKRDDCPPTRAEERAALLEELARSQAGVDPALQA